MRVCISNILIIGEFTMAPSKGEGVYCLTLTCLSMCLSVCKNKFLSKISYPLLTADALNFNALFVEACHMVGLIFNKFHVTFSILFQFVLHEWYSLSIYLKFYMHSKYDIPPNLLEYFDLFQQSKKFNLSSVMSDMLDYDSLIIELIKQSITAAFFLLQDPL